MRKEYDFSKAKKTRTFALGFLHLWLKFMNSLKEPFVRTVLIKYFHDYSKRSCDKLWPTDQ
jgi:hypothetical protein